MFVFESAVFGVWNIFQDFGQEGAEAILVYRSKSKANCVSMCIFGILASGLCCKGWCVCLVAESILRGQEAWQCCGGVGNNGDGGESEEVCICVTSSSPSLVILLRRCQALLSESGWDQQFPGIQISLC